METDLATFAKHFVRRTLSSHFVESIRVDKVRKTKCGGQSGEHKVQEE